MHIDIVTALPEIVRGPLNESIPGRAQERKLLTIGIHDLREYASGKHRKVDDYPFGGGAGMVLKPEPIFECIEHLQKSEEQIDEVIFLTPDGQQFSQSLANELSMKGRLVLLAGHYKGVDQRVRDTLVTREISIGDYVLSGGELPAMVLVDAIARLLPGVLGDSSSALTDSFQDDLLDSPVYTRPSDYRGMVVPEVLTSGDHKRIDEWRDDERLRKTCERRPDLIPDGQGSTTTDD